MNKAVQQEASAGRAAKKTQSIRPVCLSALGPERGRVARRRKDEGRGVGTVRNGGKERHDGES